MSQNLAVAVATPVPVAAAAATTTLAATALANAASTAVMELGAIPSRSDARRANAAAKRAAKGIAKHGMAQPATGTVASAQERAEIIAAATGGITNAAEITQSLLAMDAAAQRNVDINDPDQATSGERKLLLTTAKMIAMGVGLGASAKNDHAYGPLVRTVNGKLLASLVNKRTPTRDDFSAENLEKILTLPNYQALAIGTLDMHLISLAASDTKKIAETGVGPADSTTKTRTKNADLARKWITSGMHVSYLQALRIIHRNGKRVQFGEGNKMVDLPLADALATAFGRNLTAGELYRREKAVVTAHAEVTAVKQTAAATIPTVPAVSPVTTPVFIPATTSMAGAFDVPTPVPA